MRLLLWVSVLAWACSSPTGHGPRPEPSEPSPPPRILISAGGVSEVTVRWSTAPESGGPSIEDTLRLSLEALRTCHADGPPIAGTVRVELRLAIDGEPDGMTVSVRPPALEPAAIYIEDVAMGWRFGPQTAETDLVVEVGLSPTG